MCGGRITRSPPAAITAVYQGLRRHILLYETAVIAGADHLSPKIEHVGLRRRTVGAQDRFADLDQRFRVLQLGDPLLRRDRTAGKGEVAREQALEHPGIDERQAQPVHLGHLGVQVRHDGPGERIEGFGEALPRCAGGVVVHHQGKGEEHAHQEQRDGEKNGSPDRAATRHRGKIPRNLFHVPAQSSPFTAPGSCQILSKTHALQGGNS